MKIEPGDLLFVPFRKGQIVALAVSILKTSPFASRAKLVASTYADIKLPRASIELLDWIARQTFTSRPAVLKAWLRDLPKRPFFSGPDSLLRGNDGKKGILSATWNLDHQTKMVETASQLLADGKRVLIISPWKPRTDRLRERLGNGAVLHSDLNAGDAFRAWTGFLSGEITLMITTRVGAWMAPFADVVLIDEPENDDHKQDEMAPRYDARKIAIWCAEHAGVDVHAFGLTPPLHVDDAAPEIPCELEILIRHPNGHSPVPCIQAETLNRLIAHERPTVVFHPVKGDIAKLTCRDCGWQPVCKNCEFTLSSESSYAICRRCGTKTELPLQCSDCGGTDLGKSLPGIDRLKNVWSKKVEEAPPDWRSVSVADLEREFLRETLVVVTDPNLLGPSEDVRRQEKLAVTFRRLANRVREAEGFLLIQTQPEHEGLWREWLTTIGFNTWREKERAERKVFGYPPSKRLIKIILEDDDERILDEVKKVTELRGPFKVPHRPKSRKDRFIWLASPKDQMSGELMDALAKLSTKALIDLDPIAFFR
ncbi:hypothetical protein IT407_00850 [Candidatus Uhrbacteria bacterium]|nr:hypothetical protein [Candidatus Uhrbacteria bacterium]